MRIALLLCVGRVASCGDAETSDDIADDSPDDMAIVVDLDAFDLAPATVDLASWCAGALVVDADGGVGGNCVTRYFTQFATCFRPGGTCSGYIHNEGTESCWSDGATSSIGNFGNALNNRWKKYWMDHHICLVAYSDSTIWPPPPDAPVYPPGTPLPASTLFCASTATAECADMPFFDGGGGELARYDGDVFTCPDGTRVTINLLNRPALTELLGAMCPAGAPFSTCDPP